MALFESVIRTTGFLGSDVSSELEALLVRQQRIRVIAKRFKACGTVFLVCTMGLSGASRYFLSSLESGLNGVHLPKELVIWPLMKSDIEDGDYPATLRWFSARGDDDEAMVSYVLAQMLVMQRSGRRQPSGTSQPLDSLRQHAETVGEAVKTPGKRPFTPSAKSLYAIEKATHGRPISPLAKEYESQVRKKSETTSLATGASMIASIAILVVGAYIASIARRMRSRIARISELSVRIND